MKKFTLILLGLLLAFGASAQDIKKTIKSATASSQNNGEGINRAIDGDLSTYWHSQWQGGSTTFPVTVTINFAEAEHVDYLRYVPRSGNSNGNWNKVTLAYLNGSSYEQIGSYTLGGASTSYEFDMPEGGITTTSFRFTIQSGTNGFASAAEIEAYERDLTKAEPFTAVFKDRLCLELKDGITSSEGITDPDVKQLVDNLLTNPEKYKKFRVGEYEPYMTTSTLQSQLKTSSQYCNYENPTGIYLKKGESCIVMADGIGADRVQLKIKNWVTSEENSSYGLRNGFNYITASTEGNVFVGYYTDNYQTAPNVRVHFVNAPVLGYWDRDTMTNADWKEMLSNFSGDDNTIIITRSKQAQTAYPIGIWKKNCPENISGVMDRYEEVQNAEREMMGLEKYGRQTKNRQLFYATSYGFMAAGGEGAYCHTGSLAPLMTPDPLRFGYWGVGHEWGHNNQIVGFKWSGCGETTNNIYASWAQLTYGDSNDLRLEDEVSGVNDYSGMRGGRMQTYFEENVRKGVAWQLADGPDYFGTTPSSKTVTGEDANGNSTGQVTTTSRNYDHFVKLVPFWQMNLWGTKAGKCPDIIPMIIEAIRRDKSYMTKYPTNGKLQMNWMKLACDSAQLNLLPFFEKAGMLRPIKAYIEDYGAGWNIITASMISTLKKQVEKKGYPTPTEEINYINGHNYHIYRDCLPLEVPATIGTGCSLSGTLVTVQHSQVKNAVAFETYSATDELIRITMYGLGSNAAHSFTQVLYPRNVDESKAAAYIMAVGYDGTRKKIFEHSNVAPGMRDNAYYRIISSEQGNALSCGSATGVNEDGTIQWNMKREAKNNSHIDQIWQWQMTGENSYMLYNPQSDLYFSNQGSGTQTQLYAKADAPEWQATYVEGEGNEFVFCIKGSTTKYLNAGNSTDTGLDRGGVANFNNFWTVERVTDISVGINARGYQNVCYPFPLELPEGLKAYVVSAAGTYDYEGTDYDYALLEEIKGSIIPARMPVILGGKQGSYKMTIAAENGEKTTTTNLLHGTTLKATLEKGSFLSNISNSSVAGTPALIKTSVAATVPANKSYLLTAEVGGSEQLYIDLRSVHDGIGSVRAEESGKLFHDLNGTPAHHLQKGHIYITPAGKKILVK